MQTSMLKELGDEMGGVTEIIGIAVIAETGGKKLAVVGEQNVEGGPAQADYPCAGQRAQCVSQLASSPEACPLDSTGSGEGGGGDQGAALHGRKVACGVRHLFFSLTIFATTLPR